MPTDPYRPSAGDDRPLDARIVAALNESTVYGVRAHLAPDGRLHLHPGPLTSREDMELCARYEVGGGRPLVYGRYDVDAHATTVRAGLVEVVIHWPPTEEEDDGPEDFGDHSAWTFGFYEGM